MNKKIKKTKKSYEKLKLYIMSLESLFFFVAILTVKIKVDFDRDKKILTEIVRIAMMNWLFIISIVFIVIGIIFLKKLNHDFKGVMNPTYKVEKITNMNYQYITFIATYIFPLICIDFSNLRYCIIFILLIIIMGIIFINLDLYYTNPILAFYKYRLYEIEITKNDERRKITALSKDIIKKGDSIEWKEIDCNVWYIRRKNEENNK